MSEQNAEYSTGDKVAGLGRSGHRWSPMPVGTVTASSLDADS